MFAVARNMLLSLLAGVVAVAPARLASQSVSPHRLVEFRGDTALFSFGDHNEANVVMKVHLPSLTASASQSTWGNTPRRSDLLTARHRLPSGRVLRCTPTTAEIGFCKRWSLQLSASAPAAPIVIPPLTAYGFSGRHAKEFMGALEVGRSIFISLNGGFEDDSPDGVEGGVGGVGGILRIDAAGRGKVFTDSLLALTSAANLAWDGRRLWIGTQRTSIQMGVSSPAGLVAYDSLGRRVGVARDASGRSYDQRYTTESARLRSEAPLGATVEQIVANGSGVFAAFKQGAGVLRSSDSLWTWFVVEQRCRGGQLTFAVTTAPLKDDDKRRDLYLNCDGRYSERSEYLTAHSDSASRISDGRLAGSSIEALRHYRLALDSVLESSPRDSGVLYFSMAQLYDELALADSALKYAQLAPLKMSDVDRGMGMAFRARLLAGKPSGLPAARALMAEVQFQPSRGYGSISNVLINGKLWSAAARRDTLETAIYRFSGDPYNIALTLGLMAIEFAQVGNKSEAERSFQVALDTANASRMRRAEARLLMQRSQVRAKFADEKGALADATAAAEVFRQLGDSLSEGLARMNLAQVASEFGNSDVACRAHYAGAVPLMMFDRKAYGEIVLAGADACGKSMRRRR
ncbi:MAG: hypothetical protein K2R93_19950 [Gemmatimonadaceae bacterium]|nr:hypothetical protein [Gemmatimonadaceae bacterium]